MLARMFSSKVAAVAAAAIVAGAAGAAVSLSSGSGAATTACQASSGCGYAYNTVGHVWTDNGGVLRARDLNKDSRQDLIFGSPLPGNIEYAPGGAGSDTCVTVSNTTSRLLLAPCNSTADEQFCTEANATVGTPYVAVVSEANGRLVTDPQDAGDGKLLRDYPAYDNSERNVFQAWTFSPSSGALPACSS
jgi:hypothetical protein